MATTVFEVLIEEGVRAGVLPEDATFDLNDPVRVYIDSILCALIETGDVDASEHTESVTYAEAVRDAYESLRESGEIA